MLLYLIRHAHAVDDQNDAARTLSRKGREQVRLVADFLQASDEFTPDEMWHSSLVRARETAELFAERMKNPPQLIETAGLQPEDSPDRIVTRLAHAGIESLALVGHEPHLSTLASLLVARTPEPRFIFKKCTVLALEGTPPWWQVRWQISPELVK